MGTPGCKKDKSWSDLVSPVLPPQYGARKEVHFQRFRSDPWHLVFEPVAAPSVSFASLSYFLLIAGRWRAPGLHPLVSSFPSALTSQMTSSCPHWWSTNLYWKQQPLVWTPDRYIQEFLNITNSMFNREKIFVYIQNQNLHCSPLPHTNTSHSYSHLC